MTALFGGERTLTVLRPSRCPECGGLGASRAADMITCTACRGTGKQRLPGNRIFRKQPCVRCNGRGRHIRRPCATCKGEGVNEHPSMMKVTIPHHTESGAVLHFPSLGEPGIAGGKSGDLLVTLDVIPHPFFKREGLDLHCQVIVTPAEATLGTHVAVPLPQGSAKMKVPPGTQSGNILRLRGKGGPLPAPQSGYGDILVQIQVETPHQPQADAVAHWQALMQAEHNQPQNYPARQAFYHLLKELKVEF